jgi:hypothetical protein
MTAISKCFWKRTGILAVLAAGGYMAGVVTQYHELPPYALYKDAVSAFEASLQREKMVEKIQAVGTPDFSRPDVKVISPDEVYAGMTLVTTTDTTLRLLDMSGKVRHQWSLPFRQAWPQPPHVPNPLPEENIRFIHAHLYPNGDVVAIYHGYGDTPYGYGMVKMDANSNLLWKYPRRAHHHLYVADDGKIYTLIQDYVDKLKTQTGAFTFNYPLLDDSVAILSPEGNELDTISIVEAFIATPYEDILFNNYNARDVANDYLHANSVMVLEERLAGKFPMFKAGQILVSLRNLNAIAVIDPQTRKVVWAMRGPWLAQHDASFEENGLILLFDNRGYQNSKVQKSRLLQVNPATQGIEWTYTSRENEEPFYTYEGGSVQRLPNGNYGIVENQDQKILEITAEGRMVSQLTLNALITSAMRVPRNYLSKDFFGNRQ